MVKRKLFLFLTCAVLMLLAAPSLHALPNIYTPDNTQVFVVKDQKINVEIYNNLAQTTVDQVIINSGEKEIPCSMDISVPHGARANSFTAIVDGKTYKGVIRKKEVAREIVEDAKEMKKAAALVEERRDGVLHLELSQVKPGQQFQLIFSYLQENTYKNGKFNYSFGLTERTTLKAEEGSINIALSIKCTMPVLSFASSTHDLLGQLAENSGSFNAVVSDKKIPLFSVDYTLDLKPGEPHVLVKDDGKDDPYFSLLTLPPDLSEMNEERSIALILDKSGSMGGEKYLNATKALIQMVEGLNESDLINVFIFDSVSYSCSPFPFLADKTGKKAAIDFIKRYNAGGGTRFLEPLSQAIKGLLLGGKKVKSVVLLTDGQDNSDSPLTFIDRLSKENALTVPIFCFAIGRDHNYSLLRSLSARSGAELCEINEVKDIQPGLEKIKNKFDKIVGTNFKLSTKDKEGYFRYPENQAHMYKDTPLVFFGRLDNEKNITINLQADGTAGAWLKTIDVSTIGTRDECPFLDQQWASKRMQAIIDRVLIHGQTKALMDEILSTSEKYLITSPWTSLVFSEVGEKTEAENKPAEPEEQMDGAPGKPVGAIGGAGRRRGGKGVPSTAVPGQSGHSSGMAPVPNAKNKDSKSEKLEKEQKKAPELPTADKVPANAFLLALASSKYNANKAELVNSASANLISKLSNNQFSSDLLTNVAAIYGFALADKEISGKIDLGQLIAQLNKIDIKTALKDKNDEYIVLTSLFISGLLDRGQPVSDAIVAQLASEFTTRMKVDISTSPVGKDISSIKRWMEWFPFALALSPKFNVIIPKQESRDSLMGLFFMANTNRERIAAPDVAYILALNTLLEKKIISTNYTGNIATLNLTEQRTAVDIAAKNCSIIAKALNQHWLNLAIR